MINFGSHVLPSRNIVSYVKDHEANSNTTAKDIVQGLKRYMEPSENKSLARAR